MLICRGDSGRELLANAVVSRGRRGGVAFLSAPGQPDFQPAEDCHWIMITSVESWRAVAPHLSAGLAWSGGIVAAGERVATAIAADFAGEIRVAASAHDADMVAALPDREPG